MFSPEILMHLNRGPVGQTLTTTNVLAAFRLEHQSRPGCVQDGAPRATSMVPRSLMRSHIKQAQELAEQLTVAEPFSAGRVRLGYRPPSPQWIPPHTPPTRSEIGVPVSPTPSPTRVDSPAERYKLEKSSPTSCHTSITPHSTASANPLSF